MYTMYCIIARETDNECSSTIWTRCHMSKWISTIFSSESFFFSLFLSFCSLSIILHLGTREFWESYRNVCGKSTHTHTRTAKTAQHQTRKRHWTHEYTVHMTLCGLHWTCFQSHYLICIVRTVLCRNAAIAAAELIDLGGFGLIIIWFDRWRVFGSRSVLWTLDVEMAYSFRD